MSDYSEAYVNGLDRKIDDLKAAVQSLEKSLDQKCLENIKLKRENEELEKLIRVYRDAWQDVVRKVNI